MAIDERARHELFVRLEQVLGTQEAATLMEHLPPVGWADVATKRDLEHLRVELVAQIRAETATALAAHQRHMTSILVGTVSGSMVSVAALAFAAAKLV
jgi:hypothetical protein